MASFAKDAELTGVFGRRGSGKSTIVMGISREPSRKKVVVFDTQREYGGAKGWKTVSSLSALVKAMRAGWKNGFRIAYVPTAGEEVEELDKLTKLLWDVQAPYDTGKDRRKLTLIIEEANLGMPNHALPKGINGVSRLINQGRHRGLEAICVSQRPALVSKTFRANCTQTFVFPLADHTDRQEIGKTVGPQYMAELNTLQKYNFWVLQDGQIKRGKTKPEGGYTLKR